LKDALDWLRDTLADTYVTKAAEYLVDPWSARDDYIDVILDREEGSVDAFFERHGRKSLSPGERTAALKLLEAQRHCLLMYTSCGWFFDEISGIETVQIMQYADRAIQLTTELYGNGMEKTFTSMLEKAKSNIPEQGDGALIYDRYIKPVTIDLKKVAVHYAVSSVVEDFGSHTRIYSFMVEKEDYFRIPAGNATLTIGRVLVTSRITGDSERISFAVVLMGGHAFNGGARTNAGRDNRRIREG